MKGGTQAALALGFGYLLGRRRKLRRAAIVAGAMATGGVGGIGSAVLKRGAQSLGSADAVTKLAPGVGAIADTVKGQLVQVGKQAAMAAVNNKIDSLSDSLRSRTDGLRDPAEKAAGAGGLVRGKARKLRGADRDEDADAQYDQAPDDGEWDEDDLAEEEDRGRGSRDDLSDEEEPSPDDEYEDVYDEDDESDFEDDSEDFEDDEDDEDESANGQPRAPVRRRARQSAVSRARG